MEAQVEDLQTENIRLQREIEETNQQKIQAAEYGLAVLQEKQQLQEQLEQLELINEQTSSELQHLKQVKYATDLATSYTSGNPGMSILLLSKLCSQ